MVLFGNIGIQAVLVAEPFYGHRKKSKIVIDAINSVPIIKI